MLVVAANLLEIGATNYRSVGECSKINKLYNVYHVNETVIMKKSDKTVMILWILYWSTTMDHIFEFGGVWGGAAAFILATLISILWIFMDTDS